MSIVVVGSIAFDTVKTPFGESIRALGGAANYFAVAASIFSPVKMLGIVGDDYPENHFQFLKSRGVDCSGVSRVNGTSFHWQGDYGLDLNNPRTLKTELNVFEHFKPVLNEDYRHSETIFLANIDPDLQLYVLKQMNQPKLRALDTMNFWIEHKRASLIKAIAHVDLVFVNDAEIRALSGEHNIIKAARAVNRMGARTIVIKRGEYGALLFHEGRVNFAPAYPLEDVFDPTGAGDTFAGAFLGVVTQEGQWNERVLHRAMLMGSIVSSFVIEQFSFDRLKSLSPGDIEERQTRLRQIAHIF
jgi:sugar/nucleoside kinase (ribokinase family)